MLSGWQRRAKWSLERVKFVNRPPPTSGGSVAVALSLLLGAGEAGVPGVEAVAARVAPVGVRAVPVPAGVKVGIGVNVAVGVLEGVTVTTWVTRTVTSTVCS